MNKISFIRDLFHQPYFVCLLAIVACVCFYLLKDEKRKHRKIIWTVFIALFSVSFCIFIASAVYRVTHPQIWDFNCFYLWGKVAVGGYDYYQPENLHHVFNSLTLPALDYAGFKREIVDVGFLYPPPTILYFAPLGYLSYNTAILCWTIFNLLFAAGCIYLSYTLFFKAYKLNGFLLIATLFLIFLPSLSTVNFSQTNFILLFYLLLMKKYEDKKFAGIFLALALFTKPYMIILVLFFILKKKWGIISYFVLSCAAILGLTLALFGKAPFVSYIFDSPIHRLPESVFSEDINQSLQAVLLRHHLLSFDKLMLYKYIMAAILAVTGVFILFLLKRKQYDFILATLLLVGLMIYPGTLSYYGVLMLFIIFQFFDEKNKLGFNVYLNIPIIGIFYYLTTYSVFLAICFLLSVIVIRALKPPVTTTDLYE